MNKLPPVMKTLTAALVLAISVLCGTPLATAQSASADDLAAGKLLVSAKGLPDPNFAKSVILLIQYDQNGAVGLVINRRTEARISSLLQGVDAAKHASDPIYIGGPVEMQTVLALVKSQKKPDDSTPVVDDVYLVSTKPSLQRALTSSSSGDDLRVYVGYSGWGAGQLENEVRQGGWWVFVANASTVFDANPGSLWPRLIVRTEQQIAEARLARVRPAEASSP